MILGGVPYYWSLLDNSLGLAQNIDNIFFSDTAPLKNEFQYLFSSLFKSPEVYVDVIQALGTIKAGMTNKEIQQNIETNQGGRLTRVLEDLENCGFIRSYQPFGKKKKGALYQLIDNFVLFYFKFLTTKTTDTEYWSHLYTSSSINAWRGNAFERVCLWHVPQIKRALRIDGIHTEVCSWSCDTNEEKGIKGTQIDLVIDRSDKMVNLCEMKYCGDTFTIDKSYEENLRTKLESFRKSTKTNKGIQLTMVTTHGVTKNSHSGIVNSYVSADDLFID